MKTALIWYTWFVWSNLLEQHKFDDLYNSQNIEDIKWKDYDLVVCAWVKAVKWWANQNPEEDLQWINNLISNLKEVNTKKFVLISTVDVYPNPIDVDESFDFDSLDMNTHHAYGKNRIYLENFIKNNFANHNIIRLPGLFWNNLKKNVIFDLLNNNQVEKIIPNCSFQYYYLGNIWKDIQLAIKHNLKEVNFNSEPIQTSEIINKYFQWAVTWIDTEKPVIYDYKTKYHEVFWWKNHYMYVKNQVLEQLWNFISNYKKSWN